MWINFVVFITKEGALSSLIAVGKQIRPTFLNKINICPIISECRFCRASSKQMFYSTNIHNIGTSIDQHVVIRTSLFTRPAFSGHISSAHWIKSLIPPPIHAPTLRGSLNLFIADGNVLRLHLSYPVTTCWRHPDWAELLRYWPSVARPHFRAVLLEQGEQAQRRQELRHKYPSFLQNVIT